jgi:radial spoke head protein 4A
VSYNDKFANVYMGDGLKDLGSPIPAFAPPPLPAVQGEYVAPEGTPDILAEQIDPSIEAEAALEAERRAKEEAAKAQQEGGEAEEPEEDE